MRVRQLQVLLAPEDVARFLSRFVGDRVANLALIPGDGFLRVRGDYGLGFLPVPIELTLRVAGVRPDGLDVAVLSGGQPSGTLIHDTLRSLIQNSRIPALRMEQGVVTLQLDRLAPYLRGATFQLRTAAFTPEGIAVGLADLVLPL